MRGFWVPGDASFAAKGASQVFLWLRRRGEDLAEKNAGFKAPRISLSRWPTALQEKEKAYWNWLADAKQAVAARPGVAPLHKFEGKSVEELLRAFSRLVKEMVAEKKAALNKEA